MAQQGATLQNYNNELVKCESLPSPAWSRPGGAASAGPL